MVEIGWGKLHPIFIDKNPNISYDSFLGIVMFEKLKDHSIVAWDVDGVLLNHTLSLDMHNFISANPYNQTHHIVTFRSHGSELRIFADIGTLHKNTVLKENNFASVSSIPKALYESQFRYVGQLLLPNPGGVEKFQSWKGEIAKSLGATVLIDDETANVLPGCHKHGIMHHHPDEFLICEHEIE
jgi:hypothetical protein